MEKYLVFLKKYSLLILAACVVIAAALHLSKSSFPCLNSDEAAFGYNSFSIAATGRDEYGNLLPLRFKSFGENKLPAMVYLTVPFVKLFGLNEFSTRIVVALVGIFSPLLFYLIAEELFKNRNISLTAAFLASISIWIQVLSRHAHEAILAYGFLLVSLLFFIKFLKGRRLCNLWLVALFYLFALFSHHIAKPFILFFAASIAGYYFLNRTNYRFSSLAKYLAILLLPVAVFLVTEIANPTNRINNLLFFQNEGFHLSIDEAMNEHNFRILHNKLVYGSQYLLRQYLSYFSVDFLVNNGDNNPRFGFPGLSPLSVMEFLLLLAGLYYLFRNKAPFRKLLVFLLLVSPASAFLSWQEQSLTRAFFMIVPIILIGSYGFYHIITGCRITRLKLPLAVFLLALVLLFSALSWEFYFFHYSHKPVAIRSWQCGYNQLADYVRQNYNRFDKFYITKEYGQPYIFLLYYLKYPPQKYQQAATLTGPDRYGFGQVEKFDKFIFNTSPNGEPANYALVAYPYEFKEKYPSDKIKKISYGSEDIFWIYESVR